MSDKNINKKIEHTLLKRDSNKKDIEKLIDEAIDNNFHAICIFPFWIDYATKLLSKKDASDIKIVTVVGFPFGINSTKLKSFEAAESIIFGADEIDFVVNITKVKERDTDYLKNELKELRDVTKNNKIKLIIEISLLTKEEIKYIVDLANEFSWDYIKTSTGIMSIPTTKKDVEYLNKIIGKKMKIKASGGIKDYKTAKELISSGASKLGTSNGIAIMKKGEGKKDY